jgi:hypothetical protein
VAYEDIEMLGHWCGAHIVKSYLTGMPIEAIYVRAGHVKDAYLLPRARFKKPDDIAGAAKALFFPWADDILAGLLKAVRKQLFKVDLLTMLWNCSSQYSSMVSAWRTAHQYLSTAGTARQAQHSRTVIEVRSF